MKVITVDPAKRVPDITESYRVYSQDGSYKTTFYVCNDWQEVSSVLQEGLSGA